MKKPHGVVIIEYVLFLPVVLLLVIASAEAGRAFQHYNALTKSVGNAARLAAEIATTNAGTTGVTAITASQKISVQQLTVYGNTAASGNALLPGFLPAGVNVNATRAGVVNVSATYAYQPIFSGLPLFGNGNDIVPTFTFQVTASMRAL